MYTALTFNTYMLYKIFSYFKINYICFSFPMLLVYYKLMFFFCLNVYFLTRVYYIRFFFGEILIKEQETLKLIIFSINNVRKQFWWDYITVINCSKFCSNKAVNTLKHIEKTWKTTIFWVFVVNLLLNRNGLSLEQLSLFTE